MQVNILSEESPFRLKEVVNEFLNKLDGMVIC
jgi:hypothetical protein